MSEELHRIRMAVDVIVKGKKKPSPATILKEARELSGHAHALLFQDAKNIEVVFTPKDERVVYAHYHDADGVFCDTGRHGCYRQGQDGLGQEDLG